MSEPTAQTDGENEHGGWIYKVKLFLNLNLVHLSAAEACIIKFSQSHIHVVLTPQTRTFIR